MPSPIPNDDLRERIDLMSELTQKAEEYFKNNQNEVKYVLVPIKNLQREINRNLKDQTAAQKSLRNIQKEISKTSREINNEYATGVVDVDKIRSLYEKIARQKRKEIEYNKIIAAQDVVKGAWAKMFTDIGLEPALKLSKEFSEVWAASPLIAVLTLGTTMFKSFLEIFSRVDGAAADFRKNMGFLRTDTALVEKNIREMYFNLSQTGVEAKDFYESLQEVSKAIGTSQAATMDMSKDMALMSAQLGVAQGTSAEFARSMGMMAGSTMDSQKNISLFVAKLSAAAGTNLNEVMGDVANATKSSYQFMVRSPIALAKAAVEAKKMGTSISEAAKSAETLINFTDSVAAEMKASVLLGESINLQRARELAYRKDLAGLNKEILDIAKQAKFEELDPFQQKAVAEALGKSADELGKMLQADREMARIRSDPNLAKQVKAYNEMKNANESTVKSLAEQNRQNLSILSNQQSIKAISIALKSLYQSMFQPLVEFAAYVLPKIASGIGWINKEFGTLGKIISGVVGITTILVGAKAFGKIISMAGGGAGKAITNLFRGVSVGVKSFGQMSVIRGAFGMLLVATSLIPLAYALKLMEGVKPETFWLVAGSLMALTAAVIVLGALMTGAWELILAGAAAMVLIGVSLIPTAIAFQLFGDALKSLGSVDLMSIASGLTALTIPIAALTALSFSFPLLAASMMTLGLGLRFISGPIEKAGAGANLLGTGLEKTVTALQTLKDISITSTLKQFNDLAATLSNISEAVSKIPDIKIEKLQNIIVKSGEITAAKQEESTDVIVTALVDIKLSVEKLRMSLEKGGILASVSIDSQNLDSGMARNLAFRGTKTPQPTYIS